MPVPTEFVTDGKAEIFSTANSFKGVTMACADPGIFVRGDPGQSDKKKKIRRFFFVLSLFYRSQMVHFKEICHFSRFQHFSGGGGGGGGVQLFPGVRGGPIA